jgi:hypothetical protein
VNLLKKILEENGRNNMEELFIEYQPEIWKVEKDTIYAAISAVEAGLEYAKECLAVHDTSLGRTTLKNKNWAETIEKDIRELTKTLAMLKNERNKN